MIGHFTYINEPPDLISIGGPYPRMIFYRKLIEVDIFQMVISRIIRMTDGDSNTNHLPFSRLVMSRIVDFCVVWK